MRRSDLIAQEKMLAASYRREAAVRRRANAALADRLEEWATSSDRRAEEIEFGPLFRDPKPQETRERQREEA
jgi:hypothetical protein